MTWGQRVIMLAVTFLLAWLLGPAEFGTFAMALVYILFVGMFLDKGLSTAVIQRRNLEPDHLNSAFWIIMALSIGLAIASVGLSGWWAAANRVPELAQVITVLSLMIPLEGLSSIHRAVLQRELDFRALAGRLCIASLGGGAVGIGLALSGAGLWALVAQQLSTVALQTLLLWQAHPWRPRFRFSRGHAVDLIRFSVGVYLASAGTLIHRRSDLLLVGLFFGPLAAGIYHVAERLVQNVTEGVTRPLTVAALPHFSELQADPVHLKRAYLQCIRVSALVTVSAMTVLAVISTPLVAFLGPSWTDAAQVVPILCVLGAARSVTLFTGPLLYATSRPGLMARLTWTLAAISVPALVVAGVFLRDQNLDVGDQVSGIAIVRAAIFGLVYAPINIGVAMRICGISFWTFMQTLVVPMAAATGILVVGIGTLRFCAEFELGTLATFVLVSVLAGSTGLAITAGGDAEIRSRILSQIRKG
jgi:PST family polysaccharide transporter